MDARVKATIGWMQRSLASQLSMIALSNSVNLSPARLRQLFKKDTGRSPMEYLRDLRMQRAQELLRSTFLSVKEIAFHCGMNDISHFVRDFKVRHGLTPSTFRSRSDQSLRSRGRRDRTCE